MNEQLQQLLQQQLAAWKKEAEVAKRPSQREKALRKVAQLNRELCKA